MATNTILYERTSLLKIVQNPAEITGNMIRSLRIDLDESLSEFGWTLKRAVDPHAKRPYSRQYIYRLEQGDDRITPEIAGAVWAIATAFDGVAAGIGGAASVSLLAAPGQIPPEAYIPPTAQAVKCARPGCAVIFVKTHPRMRYHHPECGRAAGRERAGPKPSTLGTEYSQY